MPTPNILADNVVQFSFEDKGLKEAIDGIVISSRGAARNVELGFVKSMAQGAAQALLMQRNMQRLYKITGDLSHLDINSVRMRNAEVKGIRTLTAETQKYGAIRKQLGLDAKPRVDVTEKLGQHTTTALGVTGGAFIGASGLAFAGAAAAGQTTLDTLTGSIKKLALTAGGQAQGAVLQIARLIQRLGDAAEHAPSGSITVGASGLTGAAIGGRLFGAPGAMAGAGVGILAGGYLENAANHEAATMRLAAKIAADKDNMLPKADAAAKKLRQQADIMTILNPDWERTIGSAEMLEKAAGMVRDPNNKFKTAGLGMPGSFSGLADLRQQAQLAVFSPGGELGAANTKKELENNLAAMNPVVNELKGLRQDLKNNGMQAPLNQNP